MNQALTVAPAASAAAAAPAIPLAGRLTTSTGAVVGTVTGEITRFTVRNNQLTGVANLTGKAGSATQAVTGALIPIRDLTNPRDVSGVVNCQILNLILGPLNLNLLGLVVTLNKVLLNITAVPGSGNLLGNLLCAVVHLLDGPPFLNNVAALLNQILDIIKKIQGT